MKLDRVRNAKRGIIFGLFNQIASLFLPFLIQLITIRQLGIEYIGVKGLFSSILTVFSLAELGFGNAIVYAMYRPIAEDDTDTICALLNLYKKIYRIIGIVVLALGLAVIPFLNVFIKDSYPEELHIEVVFLLYLANTILSYWLFAYKLSLLSAYQRTDVSNLINSITQIVISCVQIAVLIVWKNFYLFLLASVIATILNNVLVSMAADKMFPELKCRGKVEPSLLKEVRQKVAGLFIGKLCGTTRNTFDSIFMAFFLGLTLEAIYSNYYYILTALNAFTGIVLTSLLGGVGNSIAVESKEKNYHQMMLLNDLYLVISGIMASFMLCLYQPFMSLWMGEENLFPMQIVVMFPLYFYIMKMGDIRSVYADAAGLFWEDRYRCILEAIFNVLLNYLLGKYLGAFGILLATILTLFHIGFMGSTIVIFRFYFTKGRQEYLLHELLLLFCAVVISAASYGLCSLLSPAHSLGSLLLRFLICTLFAPAAYLLLLHRFKEYDEAKSFIITVLKHHR